MFVCLFVCLFICFFLFVLLLFFFTFQINKQTKSGFHQIGARDKHNRMVYQFFMKRNTPQTFEKMMHWSYWEVEWLCYTEPISRLRNGCVWVCDMHDFSFKRNIDTSAEGLIKTKRERER